MGSLESWHLGWRALVVGFSGLTRCGGRAWWIGASWLLARRKGSRSAPIQPHRLEWRVLADPPDLLVGPGWVDVLSDSHLLPLWLVSWELAGSGCPGTHFEDHVLPPPNAARAGGLGCPGPRPRKGNARRDCGHRAIRSHSIVRWATSYFRVPRTTGRPGGATPLAFTSPGSNHA